jgi:multisubunit Na+/H+ antiporter MnhF subunit
MTQVRLRRAPRYRAFVVTGGLIGVLAAGIIVFSAIFPVHQGRSAQTVFLYFALTFALIGGLSGAAVAIFVERRR